MICVGALANGSNGKAGDSSFGSAVDIWAPGTVHVGNSGNNPSSIVTVSGTSIAAPFLAGTIAMVERVAPGKTTSQMLSHLLSTGRASPDANVDKIVDAMNAVATALGGGRCRKWARR